MMNRNASPRHPRTSASSLITRALSLLTVTSLLLSAAAPVQAVITVNKNAPVTIFEDSYGYNTRFPDTPEPWEYNNFFWTNAYSNTMANCLRYPGGTVGSFWNATTHKLFSKKVTADPAGWIDVAKIGFDDVGSVVSAGTQQPNTLADLKTVVDATGATVLFVMNMVTPGKDFYASAQGWNRAINDHPGIAYNASNPDDWYKLLDARYERSKQMFIEAHAEGIPVKRIEIGNEYYLANSTYYKDAFPDNAANATAGQAYAIAANYIANKLKTDPELSFLPADLAISVPGAVEKVSFASSRILNWNTQMTSALNTALIKNISLHSYQEADTNITTFDADSVKTNAAAWLVSINQTLQDKNAYATIVNANTPFNVWWNELSPTQAANVKPQWGGVLLQVFMGLWAADNKGVLFMHPNLDGPFVVNEPSGNLKQIALAMRPLMLATTGCTQAFHLNFPGAPKLATSVRTVLQGQYFENADGTLRQACILNFNEEPLTVDLSGVFTGLDTLTLSGETNTSPELKTNPIHIGDQTVVTNNVVIQPYSVNFIRPDVTAPALTLPANLTLEATNPAGAAATFVATATDEADGPVPVTFAPASGSTFPLGTTTVTATAADMAGNTTTGTFTVTVRDTTPPVLTVPANITAEATSAAGAPVTFAANATDAVGATITYSQAPGSTFPLGTTTVTVTATDSSGNSASGTFNITVQDTTAPAIVSLSASPNTLNPPNHKLASVAISAQLADSVDASASAHIVAVTCNQPVNGPGDGNTDYDWLITGPLTLKLRAERAGPLGDRIYTIVVEATDSAGNTSQSTVTVVVPH